MVIVYNFNFHNDYKKQRHLKILQYYDGVKKTKFEGRAIYLQRKLHNKYDIFEIFLILFRQTKIRL